MRKRLAEAWNEPLYRNSLYLIFNSLIMALFGFVFWSIAAKQFSSEDVGLATAVISAVSLVANLSLLGFNVSILKFKDKSLNYTAYYKSQNPWPIAPSQITNDFQVLQRFLYKSGEVYHYLYLCSLYYL